MKNSKDIRWKQRFENFEKSYRLLAQYAPSELNTDIERAGFIQFFETTFELSWKVMKDYLESSGYHISSPRETIKTAFQIGLIDNGHTWLEALNDRNLTTYTYDEEFSIEMVHDIQELYFSELQQLYERLKKEL